ncbi:DNA cytosine methyltransferase [Azospirillum cavernae]|uniref:DNA (cytosine-5-)-methyltransferase n=1 Tax=Azospirillum cavernae TaxID=2320860 RepID=A0A418W4N0_9PROT|nr:DNA cytosine methyltransferase [Azospirillum cavernae]RJF84983.1 DNA cytosine methyltransferase [Azospirillum cavernae]
MPTFYEFFAGGGMARAGLSDGWRCAFANDFDETKAAAYRRNWGDGDLLVRDVNRLSAADLPGCADLSWASFPCQDLSLAGNYEGIGHWASKEQTRSGTFWPFWRLMRRLGDEGRAPRLIALENVYGALTSNGGRDFAAIAAAFSGAGYQFGAMVIDASLFLPHSRPRLFVLGVRSDLTVPAALQSDGALPAWHPKALLSAIEPLSSEAKRKWIWWKLREPPQRTSQLADLIEDHPTGVAWHSPAETATLLTLMNERHRAKLDEARTVGRRVVGSVYKRTRVENGVKAQRAEVRFDGVAGCLRTPAGGSSRQTIIVVDGPLVRSRLLSPREAARLMGLPDGYQLPSGYNDAYHLAGDGVAVPVVRYLAETLFEPILAANAPSASRQAAE